MLLHHRIVRLFFFFLQGRATACQLFFFFNKPVSTIHFGLLALIWKSQRPQVSIQTSQQYYAFWLCSCASFFYTFKASFALMETVASCVLSSGTLYLISIAQKALKWTSFKRFSSSFSKHSAITQCALWCYISIGVHLWEVVGLLWTDNTSMAYLWYLLKKNGGEMWCDGSQKESSPQFSSVSTSQSRSIEFSSLQLSACFSDGMVQITQRSVKNGRRYQEPLVLT